MSLNIVPGPNSDTTVPRTIDNKALVHIIPQIPKIYQFRSLLVYYIYSMCLNIVPGPNSNTTAQRTIDNKALIICRCQNYIILGPC